MDVDLTVERVAKMAPDASSAAAGYKLGTPASWTNLGRNDRAIWGQCQGSALYQVRADVSDLTTACSCPSRKFPCKHGLGLLFLATVTPDAIPLADAPEWVSDWLSHRQRAAERREEKARDAAEQDTPAAAGKRTRPQRADRRQASVDAGIEAFDRWLDDLIRNGLAAVETQPYTFWERQAARMVDAKASGLAARLRRLGGIPNASPDWPARLLDRLGRLALLTEAYRRIEALDPLLQEDVRQAIGWTLKEDDVIVRGERVTDCWAVLGQYTVGEDRLRVRRTWLEGMRSGRSALLLQFAVGQARFEETLLPGTCQEAELVYWPSTYPQRALVRARYRSPACLREGLPGVGSVDEALRTVADALARQPWLERFLLVLRDAIPDYGEEQRWWVRDDRGTALLLARGEYWDLLALSGGRPLDLAGEWDGEGLRPLGAFVDGTYQRIREADEWTAL